MGSTAGGANLGARSQKRPGTDVPQMALIAAGAPGRRCARASFVPKAGGDSYAVEYGNATLKWPHLEPF